VPSLQPDGQLQKQHNIQTQITADNEQDTDETDTTNKKKNKKKKKNSK
jgi:hypothetical protein